MTLDNVGYAALNQKAVLWPFVSYDSHGEALVGDPEEIDVKWEKSVSVGRQNEKEVKSKYTTVIVDREIAEGSKLWLGKLEDLPTGYDTNLAEVVIGYEEISNLKATRAQRTVTLAR